MDICIDFDGTCVTHEFPKIGKEIGAVPVLMRLIEHGHRLILFTMRSNGSIPEEAYLNDAVNWFNERKILLWGINQNPEQKTWTSSPKAYGQLYIDDAALGAPLMDDDDLSKRPFIDWTQVEWELKEKGYFEH